MEHLSLRDYLAAKAMAATLGNEPTFRGLVQVAVKAGVNPDDFIAKDSYQMADAMLKARGAAPSNKEGGKAQ